MTKKIKAQSKSRNFNFIVTGSMLVNGKPFQAADAETVGFTQKDGSVVKLVVGLEVGKPDGSFQYLTSHDEMRKLGFEVIDYDRTDFTE